MTSPARLAAISVLAACSALGSSAFAQTRVRFDIEAQRLEPALVKLALQADISLAFPSDGLGMAQAPGLHAELAAEEALWRLLSGTGFTFERAGPSAYRIVQRKPDMAPRTPAPDGPQERDVVIVSAGLPASEADLPRDVTHIGSDDLVRSGAASNADLAAGVAGLTFTNLGSGRNKILLRGLSDGALSGRTQSLVGIYLDGARVTYAAPDPDLALVDMASVEILRGPQGALYGSGAMGGIIHLQTNPVDLKSFGGSWLTGVETTEGGSMGYDAEIVLNAPIVEDVFGIRGVLYSEKTGGWLDNSMTGLRNANTSERNGQRIRATLKLTPDWTVDAAYVNQGISSADSQYLERTGSGLRRQSAMAEPHDNDFSLASIAVRGPTPWGDLTSSTTYVRHQYGSRFDASGVFSGFGVSPGAATPMDEQESLIIVVQEARLASPPDGETPWFVDLFYADGDTSRRVNLRDGLAGALAYGEDRTDAIDELALSGQITWRLGDDLALSTGLRLFESGIRTQSDTIEPLNQLTGTASGSERFSGLAPDLRLTWTPGSGMMAYLSAAKGYRSGGFNSGGPVGLPFSPTTQPFSIYDADDIWTYEAGLRLSLLEDALTLRSTVFLSDWQSVQTDALLSNGFPYSGNVGNARATGLAIEASYQPVDGVRLMVHGQVSESEIDRIAPSFPQAIDGGLPGSPEYSGGASLLLDHHITLGDLAFDLTTDLTASYVGASQLGFGTGTPIGDYALLGLRTSVQFGDWRLQLGIENLGQSEGATYSIGNPYQFGKPLITPLRPRSVELRLSHAF